MSGLFKLSDMSLLTLALRCTKLISFHGDNLKNMNPESFRVLAESCSMLKDVSLKGCTTVNDQVLKVK